MKSPVTTNVPNLPSWNTLDAHKARTSIADAFAGRAPDVMDAQGLSPLRPGAVVIGELNGMALALYNQHRRFKLHSGNNLPFAKLLNTLFLYLSWEATYNQVPDAGDYFGTVEFVDRFQVAASADSFRFNPPIACCAGDYVCEFFPTLLKIMENEMVFSDFPRHQFYTKPSGAYLGQVRTEAAMQLAIFSLEFITSAMIEFPNESITTCNQRFLGRSHLDFLRYTHRRDRMLAQAKIIKDMLYVYLLCDMDKSDLFRDICAAGPTSLKVGPDWGIYADKA